MNEPPKIVSDLSKDSRPLLDDFDLLTKYISQVRSVFTAIDDDEQLKNITTLHLVNIIWLIEDRIDDMEKVTHRIMEATTQTTEQEASV